jgi:hypothetical protein
MHEPYSSTAPPRPVVTAVLVFVLAEVFGILLLLASIALSAPGPA